MRSFMLSIILGLLVFTLNAQEPTKGITVEEASDDLSFLDEELDGSAQGEFSSSYALLIGVSDYTNGWSDLRLINSELDSVEKALRRAKFDDVIRVKDPTEDELRDALEAFVDKYGFDENNRLLVFYSGHGYSKQGEDVGYLVPSDAPNPLKDERGFFSNAFAMEEMITLAKKIRSKHVLFLFDSCFSGTIFQTRGLPNLTPLIANFMEKPVRQFITAGSADEEVPAKSVFIPTFIDAIEGLGDLNKDGFVTGSELGMFLSNQITNYGTGQTPQYGKIRDPKLDKGEFIFPLDTNTSVAATNTAQPFENIEPYQVTHSASTNEWVTETGIGICNKQRPKVLWESDASRAATIVAEANLLSRIVPKMIERLLKVENNFPTEEVIVEKLRGVLKRSDYREFTRRVLDDDGCQIQVVLKMSEKQEQRLFERNQFL